MSKIAVRLFLVLAVVIAIAGSIIGVLRMIPAKQRYPIPASDAPVVLTGPTSELEVPDNVARNVILVIGDGMGPSYVEAARLTSVGTSGLLEMEKLPVRGMVSTHAASNLVPDSASAGTAIATGVKTNNSMIAMDPTGKRLRTILEAARDAGFASGLVTTTDVSDATPAAFATHAKTRRERDSIARQLVESGVEILMGTGVKHFVPVSQWGGRRTDGADLLVEAQQRGTAVVRELGALRQTDGLPVIGIFDEDDRPPLPDLTREAIRLLDANNRRFFLLLESEEIDSAGHDNDLGRMLSAVRELDQAVREAVDWARQNGSTLVVVTADHDTAGMQIIPSRSSKQLQVIWPTTSHTAQDVPIWAFGPGQEAFGGFFDNTAIAPRLARILGIEDQFTGTVPGVTDSQ